MSMFSIGGSTWDDFEPPDMSWRIIIGKTDDREIADEFATQCRLRLQWENVGDEGEFCFLDYPEAGKDEFFHLLEQAGIETNRELKELLDIQPYRVW